MIKLVRDCRKSGMPGAKARSRAKLAAMAAFALCIVGFMVAWCAIGGHADGMLLLPTLTAAGFPAGVVLADCSPKTLLTGTESCTRSEGKTVGLILTDVNAVYSTDAAEFNAALAANVSDTTLSRMYPVNNILNNAPSGGDVKTADVGFSGARPVGMNAFSEAYTVEGGDCLYKSLSALNGRTMRLFRVDDAGYIYGTTLLRDGAPVFAGFKVSVQVTRSKSDGSSAYTLLLSAYYSAAYETELVNMTAFAIDEMPSGLVGVELVKPGAAGVRVVSVCSRIDYTADYAGDWDTTMFVNATGGNPSAVTFSAATQLLTITPAASYRVAKANVLRAGGIYGLEGTDKLVAV